MEVNEIANKILELKLKKKRSVGDKLRIQKLQQKLNELKENQ